MPVKSSSFLHITTALAIVLGSGASWAQSTDAPKERPASSAVTDAEEASKKARESKERARKPGAEGDVKEKAQGARDGQPRREAKEAAETQAKPNEARDKKEIQKSQPDVAPGRNAAEGAAAKAAADEASKKKTADSAAKAAEDAASKKKAAEAAVAEKEAAQKQEKTDAVGAKSAADAKKGEALRDSSKPATAQTPAGTGAAPQGEASTPPGGAERATRPAAPQRGPDSQSADTPSRRAPAGPVDAAAPTADDKQTRERATAKPQAPQTLEAVRSGRRERVEDGRTIIVEPDQRQIVRQGDRITIIHDETERLRRSSRDVRVERGEAGVTRTIIARPGGTRIINEVDSDGRLIRRVRQAPGGQEIILFDNRRSEGERGPRGPRWRDDSFVEVAAPRVRIPRERYIVEMEAATPEQVIEVLQAPPVEAITRRYTLQEIQQTENIRAHMPRIDLNTITFDTGSWDIRPEYERRLEVVATGMRRTIEKNPREIFLIEGHTDAVGSDVDNLTLSDRRAESVAEALTNVFDVPPENLTTQGFGEEHLKVQTDGPERANRRVTVRRITPLLEGSR
ncbi:MAG: OmpA family protein [Beijerinckiaceae bacterium]|nr:OmpA family protein [Beijerinckiaceae bacterium]